MQMSTVQSFKLHKDFNCEIPRRLRQTTSLIQNKHKILLYHHGDAQPRWCNRDRYLISPHLIRSQCAVKDGFPYNTTMGKEDRKSSDTVKLTCIGRRECMSLIPVILGFLPWKGCSEGGFYDTGISGEGCQKMYQPAAAAERR